MTALVVALVVVAAWLASAPTGAQRRIERRAADAVDDPAEPSGAAVAQWIESAWIKLAVCVCSGAAAGAALGGPVGLVVGCGGGALASVQIGRLEQPSARRRREALERDLPLAVDLLAACAVAGRPVEQSLDVVASAVGGPMGEVLRAHTTRVRLGADPIAEWRRLRRDTQLGALARTLLRSLESGAPVVDGLQRLADDTRRTRALALQQRARSVGVRAAAPLAACFLPAFMLVGIVPTVVGGFTRLVLS